MMLARFRLPAAAVFVVLLVVLSSSAPASEAAAKPGVAFAPRLPLRGADLPPELRGRLSGMLAELYVEASQGDLASVAGPAVAGPGVAGPGAAGLARASGVADALASGALRVSAGGVQVDATIVDGGPDAGVLARLGVVVERTRPELGRAQYWVLLARLGELALLEGVVALRPPTYAQPAAGSRLTEGFEALGVDVVQALHGLRGAGVRIGVISDGVRGLAIAQASGDAPALFDQASFSSGGIENGAEGTAMIEVIHDLAPSAEISFANALTDIDMLEAVDYLAARNDIVVDDLSFLLPGDQRSAVSINTQTALNHPEWPLRAYITSVGNYATRHYEGAFRPGADGETLNLTFSGTAHEFRAGPGTTDVLERGAASWNELYLLQSQALTAALFWDDPWSGPANDYDLFLLNEAGDVVGSSVDLQDESEGQVPREIISFTNGSAAGLFRLVVLNVEDAAAPRALEIYVTSNSLIPGELAVLNYTTAAGSVLAQSDAGEGVIAVGAIDQAVVGLDTIERFSSRGPTNNGAIKPDVVAVDRVSVTGSGGFPAVFEGTSAAAAHVAGVAALLLEAAPTLLAADGGDPALERAQLRAFLLGTAAELGASGFDNVYGQGRLDALAAAGVAASPFTVSSGADAGPGTLRAAIEAVNAAGEQGLPGGRIVFAGPMTIALESGLPAVTAGAVSIDALALASGGVPAVVVEGAGAGGAGVGAGLELRGSAVLVAGLELRGFAGSGLRVSGAVNVSLASLRLAGNGVGLEIGAGSRQVRVGTGSLGGASGGAEVVNNRGDGVVISGPATREVQLQHSSVGVTRSGVPAGNGGVGVRIREGAAGVVVGAGVVAIATAGGQGPQLAGGNVIAHNGGNGVRVEGPVTLSATLRGNAIHSNGALQVDLVSAGDSPSGLTPNDAGDIDAGPNGLLNSSRITALLAVAEGGASVSGSAPPGAVVDVYAVVDPAGGQQSVADPARAGGAVRLLGSAVADDAGGFQLSGVGLGAVTVVTALATDAAGNTSEFAPNYDIGAAPHVDRLVPDAGVTSGGVEVTLEGSGFGPIAGVTVFFGEVEATVVREGGDAVVVVAPAGELGSVTVRLVKPDGRSVEVAQAFSYREGVVRTLVPGWNVLLWEGPATAVGAAFASVRTRVDRVFAFEAATFSWRGFFFGQPEFLNTLRTLEPGALIWVFLNGDGSVEWVASA